MTYCIGLLLRDGLVMIADTRTNAGVDNFSCYRKLHLLADRPGRGIFAATAGSLSVGQAVIGLLAEGLPAVDGTDTLRTLADVPTMFRAAQLVGEAIQITHASIGPALAAANISANVSILLGGRVGTARPQLFLIYSAGNFIECQPEAPFMQVGETKYGKPILDRGIVYETPLPQAVKIAFLSFDSAMRSNLGVARPLDMVVMPSDPRQPVLTRRIEPDDEYFNQLSSNWSHLLRQATLAIPDPPFLTDGGSAREPRR